MGTRISKINPASTLVVILSTVGDVHGNNINSSLMLIDQQDSIVDKDCAQEALRRGRFSHREETASSSFTPC